MALTATCAPKNMASSYPASFHSGKYSGILATSMLVGVCECDVDVDGMCTLLGAAGEPGYGGTCPPVVAASSIGFTPDPPPCEGIPGGSMCWGCGVFIPVAIGVDMFDGISDVNIVAEEGEMRYLACRWAMRASVNPRIFEPLPTTTIEFQRS